MHSPEKKRPACDAFSVFSCRYVGKILEKVLEKSRIVENGLQK